MSLTRTAVFFVTHDPRPDVLAQFQHLAQAAPAGTEFFLVCSGPGDTLPAPPLARGTLISLSFRGLQQVPGYGKMGRPTFAVVPGNPDVVVLGAVARLRPFDYYLYLEPDVAFIGPWTAFFERLALSTADLVTSQIRSRLEEPDWPWWASFAAPQALAPQDQLKALNCTMRLSRRAVQALDAAYRAGWKGHYEATVPSICRAAGLRLEDLQRPCYPEHEGPIAEAGSLCEPTTYRAAPPLDPRELAAKGQLAHPVKPGSGHPQWGRG